MEWKYSGNLMAVFLSVVKRIVLRVSKDLISIPGTQGNYLYSDYFQLANYVVRVTLRP